MKSESSPSAKQPNVKQTSSSPTSKTDWARLHAMTDADIERTAEHPEAALEHIVHGIARQGLKPLPLKASIALRIDRDVLDWFKAQGPGYQTRINAALRAFMAASPN